MLRPPPHAVPLLRVWFLRAWACPRYASGSGFLCISFAVAEPPCRPWGPSRRAELSACRLLQPWCVRGRR